MLSFPYVWIVAKQYSYAVGFNQKTVVNSHAENQTRVILNV